MRLKASIFRYALGVLAFLAPLAALVTLMPALINAEPVKQRLLLELQEWTGGEVALAGPVAIESFGSLSIRARGVSFRGARQMPNLKEIEAGQIVARISWVSLFSGKLEFDKIKIQDARIILDAIDHAKAEDAIRLLLAAPRRTPFRDFVLSASRIELIGKDGVRDQLEIDNLVADLDRARRRVLLQADLAWQGERISLKGRATTKHGAPDINAFGSFRFVVSGSGRLAERLGSPFDSLIQGNTTLAASFELAGQRLELRDVELESGLGRASGGLTVTATANGPSIEGSLALSEIDFDRVWPSNTFDDATLAMLFGAHSVDLRVSAGRIKWHGLTTGGAAFTLVGKAGRLASEIADLDLMGGSLLGHAEAEFADGLLRARTRLTAENLEAAQLVALGLNGEWLTGLADFNLEAETEGRAPGELQKNMRAKIQASFPEGGRMRFDPIHLAGSLSAQGLEGWDGVDLSWRDFADLRFEMSLGGEHLRFIELTLTTEAGAVKGQGDVDLGARDLDWRLDVAPAAAGNLVQDAGTTPDLGLSITGSWERPSIRLGRRSSRADRSGKPQSGIAAADGQF